MRIFLSVRAEKLSLPLHHRGNGIRFGEDLQKFFEKNLFSLTTGHEDAVLTDVEEIFSLHFPLRMRMPFEKKSGNFFEKFSLSSVRAEKVIPFHFTTEKLRTAFSMKFKFLYENSATFAYIGKMSTPLINYRGQKCRLAEKFERIFSDLSLIYLDRNEGIGRKRAKN